MSDTHLLEPRTYPKRFSDPALVEFARVSHRPAYSAFRLLQAGFVVAPIVAGLDKFTHLLTNWDQYLARPVQQALPFSGHTFMLIVGVIEIVAGLAVAVVPRIGAFVVAAWLAGITVNLLLPPGYYDIALRDFGLCLGAIALGLLSREFALPLPRPPEKSGP